MPPPSTVRAPTPVQPQELSAEENAELGSANVTAEEKQTLTVELYDESVSASKHTDDGKKRIVIGEYEVTLPEEKLPLLGVMACAIVLHVSIFIDDYIYASKYRYGIILSVVAFFGALVSIAIPTKKTIALNYIIYLLTFAGACLSTFKPGPFTAAANANGYFASW